MTASIDLLATRVGASWPNLAAARAASVARMKDLEDDLSTYGSLDVSIVFFGSLARKELTAESDPDWTLLVDGEADPNHLETAREVGNLIARRFAKEPGREGTFGSLSFSHDLVHQIGGQDDTNRNTTRRILLLLESDVVGRPDARDRVLNSILRRYLLEDATFARRRTTLHVPRFLLNDFARYWRTMAVDFAYKARSRAGHGFGIRNFKLRMSRKLIYVAGLLTCFSCHMGTARNGGSAGCQKADEECIDCLRTFMRRPPLEMLAQVLLSLSPQADDTARKIMDSYDRFIGILSNAERRRELENLGPEDLDSSVFREPREISHSFADGVLELFFKVDETITNLTRQYGVF
jgi:predicted nucleotidyltransferase